MLPLHLLAQELDRAYTHVRDLPVTPTVSLEAMRQLVAERFDLDVPHPLAAVFADAAELLRTHTLQVIHPRHFGLFNPSVHPSAVLADALVALYNPQVGGWSHAPAANEMERFVLDRLARSLGWDLSHASAHFTSGGNEANHTAVLAALAHRFPEWAAGGVRAIPHRPILYASREAHHSLVKVARATGLGTDALREIPVDDDLQLRLDSLERAITSDREHHHLPCFVVGTAGTTGAGTIDPLPALADLCQRHGLWFHVDAAWGGSAALSPRLRHHLAGVERADSVTWDAHKWLSVPIGAGVVFCRHQDAFHKAFTVDTGYVPPTERGADDLYKTSMQWSRRFIGLKLLFALAEHGAEGIAALVEHQAEMGDYLRTRLVDVGWRVVNRSPFPLVCTTHPQLGSGEHEVRAFVEEVRRGGRVWVSEVRLPQHHWVIRACVTSFRTMRDDVDILVEELERTRQWSAPGAQGA